TIVGYPQHATLGIAERTGCQGAHRAARQTGAVDETVKAAQGGDGGGRDQGGKGRGPQVLTQGVGGQYGADMHLQITLLAPGPAAPRTADTIPRPGSGARH